MKKALTLFTTSIIATTAIAQEQQEQASDMIMPPIPPPRRMTVSYASPKAHSEGEERRRQQEGEALNKAQDMLEKGITDDDALRKTFLIIYGLSHSAGVEPVSRTRQMAKEANVPRERLIKVLEDMIRENLSTIKEDGTGIADPRLANHLIILLGTFPDYDIAPLAKEILQAKDSRIHYGAMVAYINLEGAKAIPSLLETMNLERYTFEQRKQLTEHLARVTAQFNKENKADDAVKINAFMNDIKQAKPPHEIKPTEQNEETKKE